MASQGRSIMRRIVLGTVLPFAAAIFFLWCGPGLAADITWTGSSGNTYWNTAGNWSSSAVPGSGDNVIIDSNTGVASVVNLNTTATILNLTIDALDTLNILNGYSLNIYGNITNVGTLTLNCANNTGANLRLADGTQLTGGGIINLIENSYNTNRIYGASNSGTEVVTNVNNTIQGSGLLGYSNSIVFINQSQGVINANANYSLTITPSTNNTTGLITFYGGGFVNQGLLEATETGDLYLSGGVFNNDGGVIQADGDGSNVYLSNTTISGGTLRTVDNGIIQTVGSSTLDGTTSQVNIARDSSVLVNNGTTLTLQGTINNTGTVSLNCTNNTGANLRLADGTQLTGGGVINLIENSYNSNRIYGALNTGTEVVTNVNNTIQGSGLLGYSNSIVFINQGQGIINANGAYSLTITPTTNSDMVSTYSGGFVNQGLLEATETGDLYLSGGVFNNDGGVIQADGDGSNVYLSNTTISGGSLITVNGGIIQTVGSSTLDGTLSQINIETDRPPADTSVLVNNGTTLTLQGTINNTGTVSLNCTNNTGANLRLADGTQLTGGGVINLIENSYNSNRIYGALNTGTEVVTNVNNTIQGSGRIGYNNSIGLINSGIIDATNAYVLVLAPSTSLSTGVLNQAGGVLRGSGTGGLSITQGRINNQGLVEALANSSVTFGSSVTTQNISSNTLTGGTWRANSVGGSSATIDFQGANTFISRNDADIYLIGAGSVIQGRNGTLTQSLDSSLWDNRGSLHIQDRTFTAAANAGNFYNRAGSLLELNNATFQSASLTMNANNLADISTINSYGTSTLTTSASQVGNNGIGQINALSGTLTISNGVNLGSNASLSSSMTSYAGATINLSSATAASNVGTLNNNGSLNLGSQNINVSSDYTNANFGVGNSFNNHANVTGTGQILATGDVGISLTGADITGGTTATPTLNLGKVHVDTATSGSFAINNTGTTGPVIRGAIKTTGNELGIADQNFGPIALGGSTTVNYAYTAASGGVLSGQTFDVVTNFDNVTGKSVAINATAYYLAQGSATPTPVTIANQRVGGTNTQALTVSNTAPDSVYTEGLNASFDANTGDATNNGGTVSLLAGGASDSAMRVGVNTASAGAKTGTVTLNYVSDGTGTSDLGTTSVGSPSITVSGNVYQVAQPNLPTSVNLGNVHVSSGASQAITIENTNLAPDYQEGLDVGIKSVSNATASGSITNLAADGSSTNISLGMTASAAGINTGSVVLGIASNGTGTSELSTLTLEDQTISTSITGYRLAEANTIAAVNFGSVHVGDAVSQALIISNQAVNDDFSEKLNASFGIVSDSRILTSGSISGLSAGSEDNSSMVVSLNTSAVGTVSGTARVLLQSDGTGTSNLGITDLDSQDVGVNGIITTANVWRLASASQHLPEPVDFGNVRIGSLQTQALSIQNTALNDGWSEKLDASIGSPSGNISVAGSFSLLAPQAIDSSSLTVTLDTGTAGAKSGSATIALASNGAGTSGLGITSLPSQTVNASGNVYRLANPTDITPITLAARVDDASPTGAVSITNTSPDVYTEGLKAGIATSSAGFSATGTISNLAAMSTDASSLAVALATGTAGTFDGTATLALVSTGAGTTGAEDYALEDQSVALSGKVYTAAVSQVEDTTIDFGIVHRGDNVTAKTLTVTNAAAATALNDVLTGSFGGATGPFTASGDLGSGLAAQASDSSSLAVALNTDNAGNYNGTATASFQSHNPDMADLDLGDTSIAMTAQVNNYANGVFSLASGSGSLSTGGVIGVYDLNFGSVLLNSGSETAILSLLNDVEGPADDLNGSFEYDALYFSFTGFDTTISDLAAGDSVDGLTIAFDTSTLGSFSDSITLHATGSNASGSFGTYDGTLFDIVLNIHGTVVNEQAPVPEPATLLLLGVGLVGLGAMSRKKTKK